MLHTDLRTLRAAVDDYLEYSDQFVVDLETIYIPTAEELERRDAIEAMRVDDRSIDDVLWLEDFRMAATDPRRNTIIWIGLATYGRSDIIPVGHPNGRMLKPARREKISVVQAYGEGDPRTLTRGGKVSNRMVERSLPAVFAPPPEQLDIADVIEVLRPLFWSSLRIVNQNLKFDLKTIAKYFGTLPPGPYGETMIAQHILDERFSNYQLGPMILRHFGVKYDKLGKKGVQNYSFAKAARYSGEDARYTWLWWRKVTKRIERDETFRHLLYDIEMPVLASLMRSEMGGTRVDLGRMKELRVEKERERDKILERIYVDHNGGAPLNLNADAQVRTLLYDKYKAPVLKRTKGGKDGQGPKLPSTDAETLELLAARGGKAAPVAKLLIEYAEVQKLISTYLIGLANEADEDSFVHPDFTQHGTRTGRFSCVTGDTLVTTSRGVMTIEEYEPVSGDLVPTHLGRWMPVVAKIYNGVSDVVSVRLADGSLLTCTDDHRVHTPDGWTYVRDLHVGSRVHRVGVAVVREQSDQHRDSVARVLECEPTAGDGGGAAPGDHLSERTSHHRAQPQPGAVRDGETLAVLPSEAGREQSDAGEVRRSAPQLQGRHLDEGGLPTAQGRAPLRVSAQNRYGTAPWTVYPAARDRSASYRRGEGEQRPRQPLPCDRWGSPATACEAVEVAEVTALGPAPVFDLSVVGDESYLTGVIFSHNCREPNLQNIPRDSDLRNLFLPPSSDHVLVVGDYNQIELRLIAWRSGDPRLIHLFVSGQDVHRATAAAVLAKSFDDVTPDERQVYGKMPNFLLGFGGGAQNLADKTGIPLRRAKEVLDTYYSRFSRIKPWKQRVIMEAKGRAKFDGTGEERRMVVAPYVETWLGRRRRLPELFWAGDDHADMMRSSAERQAVNTVIQGTAADILKVAIIDLQRYLDDDGFPMRVHMSVHDELITSVHRRHADEGVEVLQSFMQDVVHPLTQEKPLGKVVPLVAQVGAHDRWEKE